MTMADRWLLPDGVDEALPLQASKIESLRRNLLDLHKSWGYQLVIPPLLEYLDSLLTGAGSDLELETFKVTDQLSGRMMGIRADFTSQVARIDAHCLKSEGVQRLSYCGSVLRTTPAGLDGTRSPIQLGAELYGDDTQSADVEIISLMLETVFSAGLQGVVLDLGHIDIVRGVMSAAGIDQDVEKKISELYRGKSLPELEAFVAELSIDPRAATWLLALPRLCGGRETLVQAGQVLAGVSEAVTEALANLQSIADIISTRFPSVGLHFDLSDMDSYSYHTGVVFAAYVPGHGNAVARGGRYDNIGEVFGRLRAATGFSTDVKALVSLANPAADSCVKVRAPQSVDNLLWQAICALRAEGYQVVQADNGSAGFDKELVLVADRWQLRDVE
ncbi:ATP phosphoribosyltransferase regulatory subunit [Maribrevibacterium harenarium]|uniref:ATP phosphoribosyltransferase regulatory subunit n=1 Tax=Maribrevibacterium harenarium TaxID=2589817 RepID=A0A501WX35_9GAMM|nr:ATP phosphoribosyltransferase regulatory subunit [Maribrevibacterium harenarium]TPE51997.1 ATP phosphoribosyltransferase regulatory subunit [Maribrevibacterium harenarium]